MKAIRPLPQRKTCRDCRIEKPISAFGFSRSADSPHGFYYRTYCSSCGAERSRIYGANNKHRRNERLKTWRRENPDKARLNDFRKRLRHKYNMSPAQLDQLLQAQGGKCWICQEEKRLVIDHNHETGRVRGLLCPICNTLLGRIEAYPNMITNIYAYLARGDILLEVANA